MQLAVGSSLFKIIWDGAICSHAHQFAKLMADYWEAAGSGENWQLLYRAGTSGPFTTLTGDAIEFLDSTDTPVTPVPDADGFDAIVRSFRISPTGQLAAYAGTGSQPSCSLRFNIRIKSTDFEQALMRRFTSQKRKQAVIACHHFPVSFRAS